MIWRAGACWVVRLCASKLRVLASGASLAAGCVVGPALRCFALPIACAFARQPQGFDAPPRGAPPPAAWTEAESRLELDGPAPVVDALLEAAAAGGWIEVRRGELASAELAVLRRVRGWPAERQKYWTERAGALAAPRLAQAGDDAQALARLVRELPGTREAGLAALRLADAAWERGHDAAGAAWLARAADHGAAAAAVAARRARLERLAAARASAEAELEACAVRVLLERRRAGPRHQLAGGAGRAAGGCVAQHGDLACIARPDAQGAWTLAEHDLRRELEARAGRQLPPAHGSSSLPGLARPALVERADGTALLVAAAGRAEDELGNALGCWRLQDGELELLWSSRDATARMEQLEGWTLEHAGAPLVVDGRVVELVRAYPGRVDDTRIRSWLVARSLVDGAVLQARCLDEGPVERAALREVNAVQPWRADPAPPPWLAEGVLHLPTGTGSAWLVGLAELDPAERHATTPTSRPRLATSTLDGLGWAPREGGWKALAAHDGQPSAVADWPDLVELVGNGLGLERLDGARMRLATIDGKSASAAFPCADGGRPAVLVQANRIWVASQGRVLVLDAHLRRRHALDLPGGSAGLPQGQAELGWIAVPEGAWLVRDGSLVFVGG